MAEDHSLHHEFEDPEGLKPQELAAMRWQAIEAFNRIPGLSPAARRVGIELICTMDAKTRACFPGELRLAGMLNMWPSAIKKGKADLRAAGLLSWDNPGGPRHQSHYTFNWVALTRLSQEAKARGELATETRKFEPVNAPLQQPHLRTMESKNLNSKDLKTEIQRPQIEAQQPHQRTSNNLTRGPELSQLTTQLRTAQHITPSQATGGLGDAEDLVKPLVSQSATQQPEPRRAVEGRKKEPPKPLVFFPQLVEVLGKDNPMVTVAISRLGWDQQKAADLLLATKGNEAALTYIREHDPKGIAA